MDWEEINAVWTEMSQQMAYQQKLTDKIILKMTKERYYNRFSKIKLFETLAAIACFIMALVILAQFNDLDTWYLICSGAFMVTYLLVFPILVLSSLYRIQHLDIAGSSYKDTLVRFFKARKDLLLIQRTGIYLNFLFLLVSLPVLVKVFGNKDILLEINGWTWYIPIVIVFMILFSSWGYKCYKGVSRSAEEILAELE